MSVSAKDYPPFALGFEIVTDRGPPVKVNAPDSEAKAQWLAAFESLNKALQLRVVVGAQSATAAARRDANDDDDDDEDLAARPAQRAEVSAAFVDRVRTLDS